MTRIDQRENVLIADHPTKPEETEAGSRPARFSGAEDGRGPASCSVSLFEKVAFPRGIQGQTYAANSNSFHTVPTCRAISTNAL